MLETAGGKKLVPTKDRREKGMVRISTTLGDIEIQLYPNEAPKACRNFLQLCAEGYYDGTIFYRASKPYYIETGCPDGTGRGGRSAFGEPFKDELHPALDFSQAGLVAMAPLVKNANKSQFLITLERAQFLDGSKTIFGKIADQSFFTAKKIMDLDTDETRRPLFPPKIVSTEIVINPIKDFAPDSRRMRHPFPGGINDPDSSEPDASTAPGGLTASNSSVPSVPDLISSLQPPTDYYVPPPPEDLKCPLCSKVLVEPMQTKYGNTFCRKCIEREVTLRRQCPITRQPLDMNDIYPGKKVADRINGLKVLCRFGLKKSDIDKSKWVPDEKGCRITFHPRDRDGHERVCRSAVTHCEYSEACAPFPKTQIEEHYKTCPALPCVHREHGCPFRGTRQELDSHLRGSCGYEFLKTYIWKTDNKINAVKTDLQGHVSSCSLEETKTFVQSAQDDINSLQLRCSVQDQEIERMKIAMAKKDDEIDLLKKAIVQLREEFQGSVAENSQISQKSEAKMTVFFSSVDNRILSLERGLRPWQDFKPHLTYVSDHKPEIAQTHVHVSSAHFVTVEYLAYVVVELVFSLGYSNDKQNHLAYFRELEMSLPLPCVHDFSAFGIVRHDREDSNTKTANIAKAMITNRGRHGSVISCEPEYNRFRSGHPYRITLNFEYVCAEKIEPQKIQ